MAVFFVQNYFPILITLIAMDKYVIRLDKPNEKEKTQESSTSTSSSISQYPKPINKKTKLGRLTKPNLHFNPM